jgi:predicted DNA-binding transcriptional regulator YafY
MSFGKAVDLLRLAIMATSRQGVTLSDVEEEFGGVRRTAQRMLAALTEVFPATERYVWEDGRHYWRLPSRAVAPLLSPSADELVALSTAEADLERAGMTFEARNLRSLGRKVRSLIPRDRATRLATDEEAMLEAMGFAARPGPSPAFDQEVDDAISLALKGMSRLRIRYLGRSDTEAVWRMTEPLGLLLGARRYLVAIDVAKRDGRLRHFRVEDILAAELAPDSFVYPAGFDLREYATRAFGSYHDDTEFGEVVWKFAPRAASRAARYQFHPRQREEWLDDGSLVIRFEASGRLEMCWHLYSWGDSVEVLHPPRLAAMTHQFRRDDFPALP